MKSGIIISNGKSLSKKSGPPDDEIDISGNTAVVAGLIDCMFVATKEGRGDCMGFAAMTVSKLISDIIDISPWAVSYYAGIIEVMQTLDEINQKAESLDKDNLEYRLAVADSVVDAAQFLQLRASSRMLNADRQTIAMEYMTTISDHYTQFKELRDYLSQKAGETK